MLWDKLKFNIVLDLPLLPLSSLCGALENYHSFLLQELSSLQWGATRSVWPVCFPQTKTLLQMMGYMPNEASLIANHTCDATHLLTRVWPYTPFTRFHSKWSLRLFKSQKPIFNAPTSAPDLWSGLRDCLEFQRIHKKWLTGQLCDGMCYGGQHLEASWLIATLRGEHLFGHSVPSYFICTF